MSRLPKEACVGREGEGAKKGGGDEEKFDDNLTNYYSLRKGKGKWPAFHEYVREYERCQHS